MFGGSVLGPVLAQGAATPPSLPTPTATPTEVVTPPETVEEATGLIVDTFTTIVDTVVARLPLIGIAIVLFAVGYLLATWLGNWTRRGVARAGGDNVLAGLAQRLTRAFVIVGIGLLALSIAGVPVGAALAGLGIAGLAIAFALQSILENFVAGLLLIFRKPFVAGDQIIVEEFEGTVTDIDLRTTRLVTYDGEMAIIPNATVFSASLVNLTHSHHRRSGISVGIDYRDDHDAASEVIRAAVQRVPGVLQEPHVAVLCTELGDSSVNFEVFYWTAPQIGDVVTARDRVLRATKSALDANGYTIPWPIRTLVMDDRGPAELS